jgi:hypothetical protein
MIIKTINIIELTQPSTPVPLSFGGVRKPVSVETGFL